MIKEDSFDQAIVQKIKERKILPKPRWLFLLKNYGIWLAGIMALIFGSLSSALLLYLIQNSDLATHRLAGASRMELLLLSVPFFWLAASAIFIYLAYVNLKNTDNGYRYSPFLIAGIVLVISFASGSVLYVTGFSRTIDNILGRRMPFYEYVANPRIGFWSDTRRGHISGIVVLQPDDQHLVLIDRERQSWLIDISRVRQPAGLPRLEFDRFIGQPLGFFGQKKADNRFEAKGLLPLRSGEGFFNRPHRPPVGPLPGMLR